VATFTLLFSVAALVIAPATGIALLGWPIARQARSYADGLEQVALSLLSGQSVLFVLQAVVYIFALPEKLVLVASVALLLVAAAVFYADLRRKRIPSVGEFVVPLLAWISLTLLALAGSSLLVVHGLPGAVFDWWEHYRRAQIFLLRLPPDTSIAGWTLAARGPLFNALAAALMEISGNSTYWGFSVFATLLNAQVLLPMAILLRRFAGLSAHAALAVAVAVLLCAPVFNWNLVFTWTKLAATNWILLALCLSLRGVECHDARLVAWGTLAMALAFLTHFLAFLYAVVLLPCLIYYAYARRLSPRPLLIGTIVGCLLVGGWMLYLFHEFGMETTLHANSTFGSYEGSGPDLEVKFQSRPQPVEVMALNLAASVLPGCVRTLSIFQGTPLEVPHGPRQITLGTDGRVTAHPGQVNTVFLISDLEGAIGWTGLALLLAAPALAFVAHRRGPPSPFTRFWCYFALVGIPINLWATRWYSVSGVLNQNFQPYLCLAVVWIVRQIIHFRVLVRTAIVGAWVCECTTRVAYILHFQTRELPIFLSGRSVVGSPPFSADEDYYTNYKTKVSQKVVMLRDLLPARSQLAIFAIALVFLGLACLILPLLISWFRNRGRSTSAPERDIPTEVA
jgi:hypothetical protein